MAKSKRKVKEGFWIGLGVIAIIILALIINWWKENAVIGWIILSIVVIGFGYSLYRFPSFRGLIFRTAKDTGKKIVFEEEVSEREPMPSKLRSEILRRAGNRCENPDCKAIVRPHIHHIDNNNNHNSPRNLIALCPNCHTAAHHNNFSNSQLRNWVSRSWESYKRRGKSRA